MNPVLAAVQLSPQILAIQTEAATLVNAVTTNESPQQGDIDAATHTSDDITQRVEGMRPTVNAAQAALNADGFPEAMRAQLRLLVGTLDTGITNITNQMVVARDLINRRQEALNARRAQEQAPAAEQAPQEPSPEAQPPS